MSHTILTKFCYNNCKIAESQDVFAMKIKHKFTSQDHLKVREHKDIKIPHNCGPTTASCRWLTSFLWTSYFLSHQQVPHLVSSTSSTLLVHDMSVPTATQLRSWTHPWQWQGLTFSYPPLQVRAQGSHLVFLKHQSCMSTGSSDI